MNDIGNKSQAAINDNFSTHAPHSDSLTSPASDAVQSQPNDSLENFNCNFSEISVSSQGAPTRKRYRGNDSIKFPKNQSPLPLILPRFENRSLQAIWFDEFNWLRLNSDDGTCHCAFCIWAIKYGRLSSLELTFLKRGKWTLEVGGWNDYRKGKTSLNKHQQSVAHLNAQFSLKVSFYAIKLLNFIKY